MKLALQTAIHPKSGLNLELMFGTCLLYIKQKSLLNRKAENEPFVLNSLRFPVLYEMGTVDYEKFFQI